MILHDDAWRGDRGRRLGRYKTTPKQVQIYGRRSTAQQKDERQDNDDKKQLARHHPSDLLRSLTREQIGGGQHGVISPALPSFAISCAPHEAPDAHAYT